MISAGTAEPPTELDQTVDASPAGSFEDVYRLHFDFVWRTLRGLRVPEPQLEDAAQEVFLVLLRRLTTFDGRCSIRTWLFGIAVNIARNQRRHLRRKEQTVLLEEDVVDDSADVAEHVENRRALALVMTLMDALNDDLRIVLFLTEVEQVTAVEIAELLGVNVNTISARLRRAREAFRVAYAHHKGTTR